MKRVQTRELKQADIPAAAQVLASSFNQSFAQHGLPKPFEKTSKAQALLELYYALETTDCFVTECGGQIVGSGFLHHTRTSAGIGPISVAPEMQGAGVGSSVMESILRAGSRCPSLRLTQDAFNADSFSFYARLGFVAKRVVASLERTPSQRIAQFGARLDGLEIRPMKAEDLDSVARIDRETTGIDRPDDLEFLSKLHGQTVATRNGRVIGFLCALVDSDEIFVGPGGAKETPVVRALLEAATLEAGGRTLRARLPSDNVDLIEALLGRGFRTTGLEILMVRGNWERPSGVDLLALAPESL